MPALQSFRHTLRTLRQSPLLFVAGLAYAVIILPQTALSLLQVPIVPYLVQAVTFFITPFVIAGLYGMADDALADEPSFDVFLETGKAQYLPLLLGKLLEWFITLVLGVVSALVMIIAIVLLVGVGVITSGSLDASTVGLGMIVVMGLLFLAILLVSIVIRVLIQFFPVAICVGDVGPLDAYRQSVTLARSQPKSVAGFTLINVAIFALASIPFTGVILWVTLRRTNILTALTHRGTSISEAMAQAGTAGTQPTGFLTSAFSLPEFLALLVITFVAKTVLRPYFETYATAFYRRHWTDEATTTESA